MLLRHAESSPMEHSRATGARAGRTRNPGGIGQSQSAHASGKGEGGTRAGRHNAGRRGRPHSHQRTRAGRDEAGRGQGRDDGEDLAAHGDECVRKETSAGRRRRKTGGAHAAPPPPPGGRSEMASEYGDGQRQGKKPVRTKNNSDGFQNHVGIRL